MTTIWTWVKSNISGLVVGAIIGFVVGTFKGWMFGL